MITFYIAFSRLRRSANPVRIVASPFTGTTGRPKCLIGPDLQVVQGPANDPNSWHVGLPVSIRPDVNAQQPLKFEFALIVTVNTGTDIFHFSFDPEMDVDVNS